MSGAKNLRKLCLDNCKNLVEVHNSIGVLDKLTWFTAIGCTSLRTLPQSFKLTSLEYLSLRKCSSLQRLPNILEEMKHMKNLDLCGTAIEQLPYSFRKLTGLKYLVLDKCKRLNQIPINILMLPKLERLTAVKCGRYVNLILGKSEGQVRLASSESLRDFRLNYNDLTPTSFPNVEFLDLTGCAFKVLPECISQCRFLRNLVLDNCKELQEIRGVPPKIKYLSAINCTLLSHESQNMLLNQVRFLTLFIISQAQLSNACCELLKLMMLFLHIVANRDYMRVEEQIFPFQEQGYQNGSIIVLGGHPCLSGFVTNFLG